MTNILWLRRDLQVADNASLTQAVEYKEKIQPVFVFDSEVLARFDDKKDRRISFLAQCVLQLQREFKAKGGGLLVVYGPASKVIPKLAKALGGDVFAGEDYEPSTIARDKEVAKKCKLVLTKQHLLLAPNEVLKKDGTPYKVYGPWYRLWAQKAGEHDTVYKADDEDRYAVYTKSLKSAREAGLKVVELKNAAAICEQIGYQYVEDKIWKPERAQEVLKRFIKAKLASYEHDRNYPDIHGTSQLSPYLRFGQVTIRQAYNAAKGKPGAEKWLKELAWRDFYASILFHFPQIVHQEFISKYRGLKWRKDPVAFKAWCEGKTGYPIIDAAMRQLNQTGWMHNRMRMVTASFLTKDLLLDWRLGEEYFAQKLMCYDQSANVGGFQWGASVGVDPMPFFRTFNSVTQGKKFDAKAEYIKQYVPELAGLKPREIHNLNDKTRPKNYPKPIVDIKDTRAKVRKLFGSRK